MTTIIRGKQWQEHHHNHNHHCNTKITNKNIITMTTLDCILEYNFGKILFFLHLWPNTWLVSLGSSFLLKCKEPLSSPNIFLIYEMQITLMCSKFIPYPRFFLQDPQFLLKMPNSSGFLLTFTTEYLQLKVLIMSVNQMLSSNKIQLMMVVFFFFFFVDK
jgi:hypothetical protein